MSGGSQSSSSTTIGDIQRTSKTYREGKKKLSISVQKAEGEPTQVQVSYEKMP